MVRDVRDRSRQADAASSSCWQAVKNKLSNQDADASTETDEPMQDVVQQTMLAVGEFGTHSMASSR